MKALCLLAALALLGAPVDARALEEPPVELVHVTANTGFAAGGHIALHVGDYAYHFEVWADGWLRLGREEWELFRLRYGTLENRGMHATELELGEAGRGRLHRELLTLWSRQSADLARLDAFETARQWSEHRAGSEAPVLPGAGFFAEGRVGDPHAAALRNAVARQLAAGHVASERARVEAALVKWGTGDDPDALRDALLLRAALLALAEERGLEVGALVDPEAGFEESQPLSPAEREQLSGLARGLEETVARLAVSRRSDRGRPLLLAMARYQAVRRSLDEGIWLLLDAVSGDEPAFEPGESERHRALLERLAERAALGWRAERSLAFEGSLDEPAYNGLEEAATGVYEMRAALTAGRPIRARALGKLVPARWGHVVPLRPFSGVPEVDVESARLREERFRAVLAERYHYDLMLRNCSTGLAGLIRLGAPGVEPGAAAFSPVLLSNHVGASRIAGVRTNLPSYRRGRVEEFVQKEGRLRVALRESNTLTSTAYEGSLRDDHFLFFADGSPWLRPAQGTANLVYGLGHAAAGLATAPFDRGQRLRGGLQGAFYSLPELVGVSIRKGRYDLVPLQR